MPAAACAGRPNLMSQIATQVGELLLRQLEDEILVEALAIAPHLFVEASRFHAVERGQVGVEHHARAAPELDAAAQGVHRQGTAGALALRSRYCCSRSGA